MVIWEQLELFKVILDKEYNMKHSGRKAEDNLLLAHSYAAEAPAKNVLEMFSDAGFGEIRAKHTFCEGIAQKYLAPRFFNWSNICCELQMLRSRIDPTLDEKISLIIRRSRTSR